MLLGILLQLLAASPVTRDVTVGPGEVIRTTTVGTGPTVLLVPGLVGSAYAFRKVIPPLATAGFRVVVVEPLGIGSSSRPKQADYSLTAQARRVAAVMDSLQLRQATVLGHSVSVSTVLRLSLLRPDLVSAIIADNGGPEEEAATSGVRKAAKYAFLIRVVGGKGRMRKELEKGLRSTAGDSMWITREVVDSYGAATARNLGATLDALKGMARARDDSLGPRLGQITVPVHLLIGAAPRGSGIKSAHTALMRSRLPRLVVDSIAAAGLHLHEERPDVVISAIQQLARGLPPPPTAH